MEAKLKKLLKQYNNVFEPVENGKLRCTVTKHELPARLEDVKNYINTKKFKDQYGLHQLMSKYEEAFEDNGDGTVTCTLSQAVIAKKAVDIERYLKGKKFAQAMTKAREEIAAAEDAEDDADSVEEEADVEMQGDSDEEEVPELVPSDEDIEESEPEPEKPAAKPLKRKGAPIKKTPSGRAKKKRLSTK